MYFFFYALLTAALFLFSGIGLAILMTPRVFEKYSLYFSPFAGLAYMSFCSWFLFAYSAWGTDQYAPYLLVPPLLFLAIAAIVKKDRIVPILFPFTKEHLMVLFICVILFLSIAYPYYSKVEGVSNTITLGNNDIVDYAATSKYLTTSSLTHPQIISPFDRISPSSTGEPPSPRLRFPESLQKNYFSAYLATAIPASLFGLETYQLQNLVLYLFFVFSLPLVYLLSVEIFGYSRNMALCSALLVGINFNLLYLVYEGFLGQIIGMGFFLCLFLTMYYPLSAYETPMIPSGIGLSGLKTRDMFSCQKCNGFFPFLPLSVLFLYGLCMSYEPLIPFIFLTLGIFLVMYSLRYPSRTRVFHALSFLLLTIFFTFLISPLTFIDRLHQTFFLSVSSGGLDLPFLYPDGIFGLNVYSLLSQSTPAIITVALSVVALIAVLVSFDRMYKENYQLFSLALASVVLVLFVYSFYSLQEAMSPSFSGDGYKAYKVMTYFIPILVLSALYYWKDLRLSTLAGGYDSKKIFSCGVIFLFIVGNLCSAGVMIAASTHQS